MDTLTVYETILHSALLRLPRTMSYANKEQRVQEIMMELNIDSIANRRIGKPEQRGISGGEKRRVSIACELVTSPSIIFLDEPTSGLDAYNAYTVIECLVALARDFQRTVIFTIHQPRSNIYALFDQLLLLAKGRVIYSGPAQQACISHFSSLGYNCPLGFNIADYLVDLTMHASKGQQNVVEEDEEEVGASSPIANSLYSNISRKHTIRDQQEHALYSPTVSANLVCDQSQNFSSNNIHMSPEFLRLMNGYYSCAISNQINTEIIEELNAAYPSVENLSRARSRASSTLINVADIPTASCLTLFKSSNKATWLTQFKILSGRTFRNLVRNPELLLTHYVIAVLMAGIAGIAYWQVDNRMSGIQNRMGFIFFITALFGLQCLSSMQAFANERMVFLRERANRYYTPLTYYLSKVILFNFISRSYAISFLFV